MRKNYMENRSFRPIKLADSLQGVNKSLENKFFKINFVIYSKWAEIVGAFFAKHSRPEKITTIPKPAIDGGIEYQENILHVNLASAAAVEFQHFQNKILEKINSFFGYQAIQQIKINQNFFQKNPHSNIKEISNFKKNLSNQKIIEIKDTIQKINDKELEKSLLNLGLSIAKNEEN